MWSELIKLQRLVYGARHSLVLWDLSQETQGVFVYIEVIYYLNSFILDSEKRVANQECLSGAKVRPVRLLFVYWIWLLSVNHWSSRPK